MAYLTRWRMYVAMDKLQRENLSISDLAGRLGYHSEAAFHRAFKRITGIPQAP